MFNIANWIEDAFEYITDVEWWELEFDDSYILAAISDILSDYSDKVFSLLNQKRKERIKKSNIKTKRKKSNRRRKKR